MNSYFDDTSRFPIDMNETFLFTRAEFCNFHPVPVRKPWRDATGGFGNFVPLQGWIRLYDDQGFCGEGFCSLGMVENIVPLVMDGEKKTYFEWYRHLYWKMRNYGFQSGQIVDVGQFEQLMLDIMARRRNLPLHRFLGAEKDWAAAYKGGGSLLSSDEELVEDMQRYVDEGYRTIKFKVGSDWGTNMERDITRLKKVREAVGPDIEIAVDANQVFNLKDAIRFADLIRPYNPAWYEEPIHSHDMNGIRALREAISMKIGYGESMRNGFAFETYAEKGVDHLMPLVGRMSRMDDLLKIRDLCREKGLRFSSGGTIWVNAAYGALYSEDELLENHEPMTAPMADCLSVRPIEKDGKIWLPDIPGLPCRLDYEKLQKNATLESVRIMTPEHIRKQFAIRASY